MKGATNRGRPLDAVVARATAARRTGRWPPWRHHVVPPGAVKAQGWASEFRRCSENGVFAVLIRDVETAWGTVRHAMITTAAVSVEPTWSERQRIKNELLGRERVAIEVFPAASQLVDQAPAWHLWAIPSDMALPFSLATPREGDPSPLPIFGIEAPCAAPSGEAGQGYACNTNDNAKDSI